MSFYFRLGCASMQQSMSLRTAVGSCIKPLMSGSFLPLQHSRRGIDSRQNAALVLHWPSGMMHDDYSHLYRDLKQHRHSGVLRDMDKWMRKGHVAFGTCFLSWPQQVRGEKNWERSGQRKNMAFKNNINQEFLCQLLFCNTSVMKWSQMWFWDQSALQYVYCTPYS